MKTNQFIPLFLTTLILASCNYLSPKPDIIGEWELVKLEKREKNGDVENQLKNERDYGNTIKFKESGILIGLFSNDWLIGEWKVFPNSNEIEFNYLGRRWYSGKYELLDNILKIYAKEKNYRGLNEENETIYFEFERIMHAAAKLPAKYQRYLGEFRGHGGSSLTIEFDDPNFKITHDAKTSDEAISVGYPTNGKLEVEWLSGKNPDYGWWPEYIEFSEDDPEVLLHGQWEYSKDNES